jgi:hypothetical protein
LQAHLLIVLGFDLASGQGHHPGFVGLAVQAIGSQLGVVGMGRDHHHPALAQLDGRGYPQARRPCSRQCRPRRRNVPAARARPGR